MKIHFVYFICLAALLTRCTSEPPATKAPPEIKDTLPALPAPEIKPEAQKHTSYLDTLFKNHGLVDIATLDSTIQVDLRYAGTNNFLKMDMYDGLRTAYFNCEAALRLGNAQCFLKQVNPALSLIVLDAARPKHIQQLMWDSLKMPPDVKFNYLAPPYQTSMHNYGAAADVSIIDTETHTLLDMGSDYDFFGKISEPVYEWKFLKSGELTDTAYHNRLLLRRIMKKAKFNAINSEWWHFSTCTKPEAMAKFKLIK